LAECRIPTDTFGDGKPLPKGLESNALRHQA
jgi:hypothetical protein